MSSASSSLARFWPLRPNPQMMTCCCRAIVVAAICVICAARASQSFAVSRRTIRSAYWMSSGADNIDSTIAASTTCVIVGVRIRCSRASASSTSANSPACARENHDQHELSHDGQDEERDHPENVLADDGQVERHPDGDEEEAEQHVAK